MEEAARQLKIDPAALRRRNFITAFPHQTPVIMNYDIGDYDASLTEAMKRADVAGFAARKEEAATRGKLRGLGYSTYIEACGIAPSAAVGSLGAGVGLWESAEVRVNPTGSVEVLTGAHSHGQGHETTFAQYVAERLGIDIDQVEIVHGDTDKVQFGMGTYGSRSAAVGLSAISVATDQVIAKAKRIAAYRDGSAGRRCDLRERPVRRHPHQQDDELCRAGAGRLCRPQIPDRQDRAGPEGDGLLRSQELHLPGRLPYLRGRDRQGDRRRRGS